MSAARETGANLPRVGSNTRTVTVGRAPRAGRSLPALAPTLSAMLCALALAGCASNSTQPLASCASNSPQHESGADPIRAAADPNRYSELRMRRAGRALLAPQPAPDCAFSGFDDLKPVDPDQWARMKLDYERRCYQHAEQLARDRLRLLQAASK
jgi:hypothetical protein